MSHQPRPDAFMTMYRFLQDLFETTEDDVLYLMPQAFCIDPPLGLSLDEIEETLFSLGLECTKDILQHQHQVVWKGVPRPEVRFNPNLLYPNSRPFEIHRAAFVRRPHQSSI